MKKLLLSALLCSLLLCIWVEYAEAIPAFARRYRLSCQTCHNPFPRLTAYGEEFAGNAFQLPDAEEPARSYADTGDDYLDLMRDFPLAVRLDLHGQYLPDNEEIENDFRFPDRAKLLSGGAIAKDIAYYFYFYMNERGEVTGIEDAYVHFNNIGGTEFDIMAGQFQICDPLFKRELRLTYEDYHIYKIRIGESKVNLAYDRGFMFTHSPIEGMDLVVELVNGNGIGEGDDEEFEMDNDSFKNVFLRASQSLGETGLRVGGVYYYAEDTQHEITDTVTYWGVDGSFDYKDTFSLNVQYIERTDDDPFYSGMELDEDLKTTGGLVEAIWGPNDKDSKYFLIFLYNWIDSDLDVYDYESLAVNGTYLLRRNIKMFAEYGRDVELEENIFTGGLVIAF